MVSKVPWNMVPIVFPWPYSSDPDILEVSYAQWAACSLDDTQCVYHAARRCQDQEALGADLHQQMFQRLVWGMVACLLHATRILFLANCVSALYQNKDP